jgi:uncharacterized protein (TIGR03083 family)
MTVPFDDTDLEQLLGAYALDACDPEEAAALEELFVRRPDLAAEAARLVDAAVWIGAREALEPPASLRRTVFDRARLRRAEADPPARLYETEVERVAREVDLLDPDHDTVRTANGLTARDLVIHLGAQESLLARSVGRPVEPEVDVDDIDERTAAYIERFRDAPYDEIVAFWRRAVQAVRDWSDDPATRDDDVNWLGIALKRDSLLIARAFENWTHRDDLRRVRGAASAPPPPPELHQMADMSMRTLTFGLFLTDRTRPGRLARVVLTGDGGGEWRVRMGPDVARDADPDVTLTTDVADWCRLASERIAVAELPTAVDGDEQLADDLLHAASAFATL